MHCSDISEICVSSSFPPKFDSKFLAASLRTPVSAAAAAARPLVENFLRTAAMFIESAAYFSVVMGNKQSEDEGKLVVDDEKDSAGNGKLHVVAVGPHKSGKTTLLYSMVGKPIPRNGILNPAYNYSSMKQKFKGKTVNFFVWDLSGRPEVELLWPMYYNTLDVDVVLFLINANSTNKDEWLKSKISTFKYIFSHKGRALYAPYSSQ
jgi:hypothetical protein